MFKEGDIVFRARQYGLPTSIIIDGVRIEGTTTKGDILDRKMVILRHLENEKFVIKNLYPHSYFGTMTVLEEDGYEAIGYDDPLLYADDKKIEEILLKCQQLT